MSKELEALDYLEGNPNMQQDRYSMEALHYIKQALTPPTEEEVCEALGEYLDEPIVYSGAFHNEIKTKIVCYKDSNNCIEFYVNLPPYLITMIGRFYEGEII